MSNDSFGRARHAHAQLRHHYTLRPPIRGRRLPGQLQKNFSSCLKEVLGDKAATAPVEVWFQDEARVGQKGSLSYVWPPIGSRPAMVRDNGHDAVYIFGAICPERGVGAAIITPAANMECMNLHLAEISTQVAPGSIAAVICDRSAWHAVQHRVFPLPSYAPEMNSTEELWDYLRANKLSACVWDGYDEILAACADAWNWLVNDPSRIRSIGAREWATVNL